MKPTQTFLERLSAFMLGALALSLLLLACHPAHADIRYDDADGDYVQVTGLPCPERVPLLRPESDRANYFLALARLGGRTGTACATLVGSASRPGVPFVGVIFDDGRFWALELSGFRVLGGAPKPSI